MTTVVPLLDLISKNDWPCHLMVTFLAAAPPARVASSPRATSWRIMDVFPPLDGFGIVIIAGNAAAGQALNMNPPPATSLSLLARGQPREADAGGAPRELYAPLV